MPAKARKPAKRRAAPRKKTAARKPAARKPAARKTAGRKTAGRKTPPRRSPRKRKPAGGGGLTRVFLVLGILVSLVSVAGIAAYLFLRPDDAAQQSRIASKSAPPAAAVPVPHKSAAHVKKIPPPADSASAGTPAYEIFTPEATQPPEPLTKPTIAPVPKGPLVALIIDDLGYDLPQARKLIALELPLTLALFPFSPHQKEIVDLARSHNLELMLHMPMEPREYPRIDPGPGALLNAMTPDQLVAQLNRNLDSLPGVAGINNHMGSRLTAQSDRMNQIFVILKKRGLFFVDSRTTTETQAPAAARLFKVPFAQRDVFLDHEPNADFVRRQVRQLVRVAHRDGHAIGIGHPYPVTHQVLRQMLPLLKSEVHIVPASQLVHPL